MEWLTLEHGSETIFSIKGVQIFDRLSEYEQLKNHPVPRIAGK
jgi:hypothetical protein